MMERAGAILLYFFYFSTLVLSVGQRSVSVEVIKYVHGDRWVGIAWEYSFELSDPIIEYRPSNGADDYKLIDRLSDNRGSYSWSVPQEIPAGSYVVRVTHHNSEDLRGPIIEESNVFSLPDSAPVPTEKAPDDHDYSKSPQYLWILYIGLALLGASVFCYAVWWYRQSDHTSSRAAVEPELATSYQGLSVNEREEQLRERLIEFYSLYSPSKLNQLERILRRYRGKEDQLFQKLHRKYTVTQQDASPDDVGEKESDSLLVDV